MGEYRAYTVGVDGHFIGFEPLRCANEAEAIEKTKRLLDGHDIELWSGERLVIRINPAIRFEPLRSLYVLMYGRRRTCQIRIANKPNGGLTKPVEWLPLLVTA